MCIRDRSRRSRDIAWQGPRWIRSRRKDTEQQLVGAKWRTRRSLEVIGSHFRTHPLTRGSGDEDFELEIRRWRLRFRPFHFRLTTLGKRFTHARTSVTKAVCYKSVLTKGRRCLAPEKVWDHSGHTSHTWCYNTPWTMKRWQYICDDNCGKSWWILITCTHLERGMNIFCK